MHKKITIMLALQSIILLVLIGCGSSNNFMGNTPLNIADFYGEYIFDEVAYMRKSSAISEEQYQNDFKTVTETFKNAEFSIGEGYFHETSGTFGKNPLQGFEFITLKDYGDKYFDDLAKENLENFEGLDSIFDDDDIRKKLDVNEIKHYVMYVEDGVLSNPGFYITKDNIFVAMETISFGETENDLKGYTHYLLKLKEN
ncbi:MAG: hypothetical protein GX996_08160 [Firmicutes bacterium]|nr:hypothetical protein [Bacillota bacterium]